MSESEEDLNIDYDTKMFALHSAKLEVRRGNVYVVGTYVMEPGCGNRKQQTAKMKLTDKLYYKPHKVKEDVRPLFWAKPPEEYKLKVNLPAMKVKVSRKVLLQDVEANDIKEVLKHTAEGVVLDNGALEAWKSAIKQVVAGIKQAIAADSKANAAGGNKQIAVSSNRKKHGKR